MNRLIVSLAVLLLAGAAGCRKTHLTKDFGRSYDAVFAAQRQARAKPAEAVEGFDPQEAAIVSEGYRTRLAPKGAQVKEAPTIFIAPPARERPEQLAPSVPRD